MTDRLRLSRYRRAIAIVRRYASFLAWLVRDALFRNKVRSIFVLVADPAGVALQVQAIGLGILYGRGLANDASYDILGHHIELRTSIALLVAVTVAIFVCIVLAAGLTYLAGEQTIRLVQSYEEFCLSRVISWWGARVALPPSADSPITDRTSLLRTARDDARFLGVITRQFLNLIGPLTTFLVAIVVLFVIQVWLTIAVLATMAVAFYFQAKVSLVAAAHSIDLECSSRGVRDTFRQMVVWQEGYPASILNEDWVHNAVHREGDVRRWRTAYDSRFRVAGASELVSNVYLASAMLLIFLLLGPAIMQGYIGWEVLAAYIIALRYAAANLRQVATKLTAINRRYPNAQRYRRAVQRLAPDSTSPSGSREPLSIRPRVAATGSALSSLNVCGGQRIYVMSPFAVNRFELGMLVSVLFDGDKAALEQVLRESSFVTENMGAPPRAAIDQIRAVNSEASDYLGTDSELAQLCQQAQQELTPVRDELKRLAAWSQMDTVKKVALSFAASVVRKPAYLLTARAALDALPKSAREEVFELFSASTVFIVSHDLDTECDEFDVVAVAVIDTKDVLGIYECGEFPKHRESVRRRFEEALEAQGTLATGTGDVEFELEDI